VRGEVIVNSTGDGISRQLHQLLQREAAARRVHELGVDVLRLTLADVANHAMLQPTVRCADVVEDSRAYFRICKFLKLVSSASG
jgi:hypothetical protein